MLEGKRLQVSYGKMRYLQTNAAKPDLVYIHGGFGDAGVASLLEQQFGQEFRITTPYLPGHGSFDFDENFSFQDLVATMGEFLLKLGLVDYVLVGHSLGGRLALEVSRRKELRVKSVVLSAPMLTPLTMSIEQTAANLVRDYVSDLGISKRSKIQLETILTRLKNLKQIWRLVTSVEEVEEIIPGVATTIVWGRDDSVLPIGQNSLAISKIVGAKLEIHAGGGIIGHLNLAVWKF